MLIDDVKMLPSDTNASLIIRHAERFSIDNMENAFAALLTEKGKKDAYLFGGKLLKLGTTGIFHSPVERCRETAVEINSSLQEKNIVSNILGQSMELGGPYIAGDWKDIVNEINKYGYNTFLRMWIDGKFSESLIMPAMKTARLIADKLVRQMQEYGHSIINVTHDWNLIILREYFFGLSHEDLGIPGYLDGMMLYKINENLKVVYHGDVKEINYPFL